MSATASASQLHSHVQEFLDKPRKMFIDGTWVEAASGKTFPTYNPATGEVMAQVAEGDREDINRAVKAARRAFDGGPWPEMSASERGRMIWKLGDLIEQHLEEFAQLESLDNGKPLSVARVAGKFYRLPGQSGDPIALRLIASSKLMRTTCELFNSVQSPQKP